MMCIHYPQCGGCTTLEHSYEEQINTKVHHLKYACRFVEGVDILPIVASPDEFKYRNKVQLPFGMSDGKVTLGVYEQGSHNVVDQKSCLLQGDDLNRIVQAIKKWVQRNQIPVYNEKTGRGFLRYLLLRQGKYTGEILLGIITRKSDEFGALDLRETLLPEMQKLQKKLSGRLVSAHQMINKSKGNTVLGDEVVPLWGKSSIAERIEPYHFRLDLQSFFQVNSSQIGNLYEAASKLLPLGGRCLELYCGTGTLSLWLASKADHVVGVELRESAVRKAQQNAKVNQITNVEFVCEDASAYVQTAEPFDSVVVDPPRKGLSSEVIAFIQKMMPHSLVYISCNPESLLQNAKELSSEYELKTIQPIDLFPHTNHLELVCLFQKK